MTWSKVGDNLRRLELHYNHQSPGINLITVGKCCPNLTEFSVCDSLVSAPNLMTVHASYRLFSHLFSLKLLRVSYSHQDDWEAIPRQVTFLLKIHSRVEGILNKSSLCADHVLSKQIWRFGLYYFISNTLHYRIAKSLKILHLESSRGMSDSIIKSILVENPLQALEVQSFYKLGRNYLVEIKGTANMSLIYFYE